MINLTDMQVVRGLAKKHDFSFSKGLGQNFLIDETVCPAIAEYGIPSKECGVLEVGAGFGVLTQQLALHADKVVAVELDRRLAPVLDETLAEFDNAEIVWQDITKVDIPSFLKEQFGEREVAFCANLPYYITSPILMQLLESGAKFTSITVMVQKEAADRLCATLGSRAAGAVTAAVQLRGTAELLFEVPRTSFYPAPNVDSAVIRITPYDEPICDEETLAFTLKMVKAGFAQRRKTAVNGLSAGLGLSKEQVIAALERCGLSATVRFEQLDRDTLLKLSEELRMG
ncbi:MAG: 16S rRNA (adenine(1518)-N(6)/adenine(1519)-N(6))-dimethyltransferase RsmA [Oscillospiraceae bacterium]|nr:16S rRNA (adenine(1518)-N(6)/adenine(1519)-N(6))-dimethyltransferase RsmA [Oscillospiraceae bacterium]